MTTQTIKRSRSNVLPIGLGVLNLLLAAGAAWGGILMLRGVGEIFAEFPMEWLGRLPFDSWTPIGCIALFFALGNALAGVLVLGGKGKPWLLSFLMGALLVLCVAGQVVVLREWYLAMLEFLAAAVLQMVLSAILAFGKGAS